MDSGGELMASSRRNSGQSKPKRPPATSPEARENQMIALAVDLAEKQLTEGKASSQVITHYLKLGTTRETLEKEKLRAENDLLKAKVESLASQAKIEELYANALKAMRSYAGDETADELED
jgi:hypothetical protein